jgi:hypothetical protein
MNLGNRIQKEIFFINSTWTCKIKEAFSEQDLLQKLIPDRSTKIKIKIRMFIKE